MGRKVNGDYPPNNGLALWWQLRHGVALSELLETSLTEF